MDGVYVILDSNGASFVFLFIFLHLGRAISYASYFYNPNTWFSGIIIYFFLMGTAFMGYVLPLGQMTFMRSYSNYKFIISISIFNRMALWRTLYLQSNIKEVLCLSFSISISSLCFSSFSYF